MNFATTSDLQRQAMKIATSEKPSIILRRGKPECIVVPFFAEYDEFLDDYMEAYEMSQNREKLKSELEAAEKSGISNLSI